MEERHYWSSQVTENIGEKLRFQNDRDSSRSLFQGRRRYKCLSKPILAHSQISCGCRSKSHITQTERRSHAYVRMYIQELPQELQEALKSEPEYNQGQRTALAKLFFSGLHDIRHFNPSDSAVQIPIKRVQSRQKPTFESILVGNDGIDQPTIRIRDLTMLL